MSYTQRAIFSRRPTAEYRQNIKGRLRDLRKLCNMSQAQAARAAGVARSTWQAYEDSRKTALPDLAQFAAVTDAARVDPAAALDWLIGNLDKRVL